jgi:hypothetical protein
MAEFALNIMKSLDNINQHSFNSFRLRIGQSTWDWNHVICHVVFYRPGHSRGRVYTA